MQAVRGAPDAALAIDTHAVTSHFAIPLLIRKPGGLVVEVNDGTAEYNDSHYRNSFFYDLAKAAVLRMGFALGHELKPHQATAVSLTPGWNLWQTLGYPRSDADYLVNYSRRYHKGLPISSSIAESAVNQAVSLRMAKKRQMRWSDEGAHLFAQVRVHALNDELRPRVVTLPLRTPKPPSFPALNAELLLEAA